MHINYKLYNERIFKGTYLSKRRLNSNRTYSKYIKKKFPELFCSIFNDLDSEKKFKEKLYKLINGIDNPPRCKNPNCNNPAIFIKFSRGYSEYCSRECQYAGFGSNEHAKEKISSSRLKIINNKIVEKYSKKYDIDILNNNINLKNYCLHGDLKITKNQFKKYLKEEAQSFCPKCQKYYLNEWKPSELEINEQIEILSEFQKKTIYNITESRVRKYYPKLYKCIVYKKPNNSSWPEKLYMFKNKIRERTYCVNCGINKVHFLESVRSYSNHCKICCKNGDFVINHKNFISKKENDLLETIKKFYNEEIISNKRFNNNEIDIFFPLEKLGIEFNGLYWHSTNLRDEKYHYNKMKFFNSNGISLITIWEDDWEYKKEIVKSIIKNKLKLNKNKIYARKTEIREISSRENLDFFNSNHIQGAVSASIRLGLFYNNKLVSSMTFGKKRMVLGQEHKKDEYELIRFANLINTSVIGGASKLFKFFIEKYRPSEIISYANCDISDGRLYEILGFKSEGHSGINYWWAKDKRYHRSSFMKHKLVLLGFPSD